MSLHRIELPDGSVRWRVRWRDGGRGSIARSRRFDRKADAVAFEDELRRRRRLGDLGILLGAHETLDQYVAETWVRTHAVTLAPRTARTYAVVYDLHIGPYLGPMKLSQLTPELVARWQADRIAAGAGRTAVLKAMSLLGAILQLALESERIARNPVRMVRKVKQPPKKEVRPLPPATVEAMRAASGLRDATLISVLAYAGLRPGEALDLQVAARRPADAHGVREQDQAAAQRAAAGSAGGGPGRVAARVAARTRARWCSRRRAVSGGRRRRTSRGRAAASRGRKREDGTRGGTGGAFGRAALAAGVPEASPYTLRHSFCSLLLHEGRSVIYVARQMGHDAKLTLGTYGHVIDELEDAPRVPAEDTIRAARSNSCVTGVSRAVTA